MYKKRGRLDIDAESANNEEQFASQFYHFSRKQPDIVISQVSVQQINLDISNHHRLLISQGPFAARGADHRGWATELTSHLFFPHELTIANHRLCTSSHATTSRRTARPRSSPTSTPSSPTTSCLSYWCRPLHHRLPRHHPPSSVSPVPPNWRQSIP
jgi:hypothetical protein